MSGVHLVVGTRPEVIKLAPVARALEALDVETRVVSTGQHRQMLDQALSDFGLTADRDLAVMREAQTLDAVVARVVEGIGAVFDDEKPDVVVVQGDTSSAFAGALAAHHHRVPVAHVEAGLRTGDLDNPFPEEMNRRLVGQLASHHFAPTSRAVAALEREGVDPASIHLTGNTVVDAALWTSAQPHEPVEPLLRDLDFSRPVVLLTAHRRENLGGPMADVVRAVAALLDEHPDLQVLFPVHLNPKVQEAARGLLGSDRAVLAPPLCYRDLVHVLARCRIVLTDSGGIQEEAPSFGKPVLVLRTHTERPEGVAAGSSILVGTDVDRIVGEVNRLLGDPGAYDAVARIRNPYGDGHAAERIAAVLAAQLRT